MYSFYIDGDDIKKFMNIFLKEDKFDKFEVRNCQLTTLVTFEIDCKLNKDWFDGEIIRDYCKWKELKPYIFELIKGKKKPKSMKFVMALSAKAAEKIHPNAQVCFINIVFEEDKIGVVTGTAQKEFNLDKSLELIWGERIREFFEKLEITQNLI
ncbi:MAG: DUF5721 family protein [Clostridia bacterium]|nr:DUF5721 family protein [Clostridia bacterium]